MSQFIIKSTMVELRSLSSAEISDLQSGDAAGVMLLGYYEKGDTPAPICYYLSTTDNDDDGGSVIEVGGVKLVSDIISVNPTYFGAKIGDVDYDNTIHLQKAIIYAADKKRYINGGNSVFKISKETVCNVPFFHLKNIRFILNNSYDIHAGITVVNWMDISLDEVHVDGGRGTYKVGKEKWIQFSGDNTIPSIRPNFDYIFNFKGNSDANQVATFGNIYFENCHVLGLIDIRTIGDVYVKNLYARNTSYKSLHVYHQNEANDVHRGTTYVENYTAIDVGGLPYEFTETVNGVTADVNIDTSKGLPQWAYGLIVTWGDFTVKNANIKNYGSCGVTSDRNSKFYGGNIVITNDSNKYCSNNPSGAMWLENTNSAYIENLSVDVSARNKRDILNDNSLLQIFNGNTTVNNLKISSLDTGGEIMNKGIRGSFSADGSVILNNALVIGLYKDSATQIACITSEINVSVTFKKYTALSKRTYFYGIKDVNLLDDCQCLTVRVGVVFSEDILERFFLSRTVIKSNLQIDASLKRFDIISSILDNVLINKKIDLIKSSDSTIRRFIVPVAASCTDITLSNLNIDTLEIAGTGSVVLDKVSSKKGIGITSAGNLIVQSSILTTDVSNYCLDISAESVKKGLVINNILLVIPGTVAAGYMRIATESNPNITQSNNISNQ